MHKHILNSSCWCDPDFYVTCDQECCEIIAHYGCHICHGTGYMKYLNNRTPVLVVHHDPSSIQSIVHFLENMNDSKVSK